MLRFDPETGLYADPTDAVRQDVRAAWKAAFAGEGLPPLDTDPATPAGQLIDGEVAEIAAKNAQILFLANMFNPGVAEGRWQDALGHIYFLTRKQDEPTVVTCTVTGLQGTTVPYGALVKSLEGHTFICNRSVTIGPEKRAETTFRCAVTGPVEISPHSVTAIVTTVAGWDTVDNESAGAVGRNLETRAEFEARRAASVAANAHGSTGALYGAIANLSGVLDVAVLENIGPAPVVKYGVTVPGHGVTVCVYGGEDEAIAEAIYRKKDNGADTGGNILVAYRNADYHNAVYEYKILRPEPANFWVRVVLGGSDPVDPSLAETIRQAVYRDFNGLNAVSGNTRVSLASKVYASRFYQAVMGVEDVKSLYKVEIALGGNTAPGENGYTDVLSIRGDQEPVTATDNIAVVARG